MKQISLMLLSLFVPLLSLQAAGQDSVTWLTQYEEALNKSKEAGLPLLMFFTGSDWCGWCNKLEKEVLDTPEFAREVGNKFVFLKLDFPLYTTIDPKISAQNKQLQKKYDITGFPTIILLDTQKLQVIGKTGYQQGGAKNFAAHLQKLLADYTSYKQKTHQLEKQTYSGVELKKLYEQAKEMDIYTDVHRLIKAGVASDEKLFFQLERYRFLVEEGSPRDPQAVALRQELLAADPQNTHRLPYQLAVIDFESLAEEIDKEGNSPDIAVSPLINYIQQFGSQDPDNLWRLEMIISQVYLNHDKMGKALEYAKSSHAAAPATVQPEIAKTIQNIQLFAQVH